LIVNLNHRDVQSAEHRRDVHGNIQVDQLRDVNEDIQSEQHRDMHKDVQVEQQKDMTEDIQFENHRDSHTGVQVKQHRDVSEEAEHRRSFVDLLHREVRMQLAKFLTSDGVDSSAMWQPYVVAYYTELTTVCLQDSLTSGEDSVLLLTDCLSSAVYDIRLASLQLLTENIGDKVAAADYDDNDVDSDDGASNVCPLHAWSQSAVERREQVCKLLADADTGLLRVLIDLLLYRETNDECLLMVSSVILVV